MSMQEHSGHWHEHPDGWSHELGAGPPPPPWKHDGVRVIPGNRLDANTAQTPGMDRKAAINFARMGAQKLWAGTVTIHANAKTGAHHHGHLESVIYIVKGRARMRWGGHLEFTAEAGPGDFIYVPPYVPHQEINASLTEVLECVTVPQRWRGGRGEPGHRACRKAGAGAVGRSHASQGRHLGKRTSRAINPQVANYDNNHSLILLLSKSNFFSYDSLDGGSSRVTGPSSL